MPFFPSLHLQFSILYKENYKYSFEPCCGAEAALFAGAGDAPAPPLDTLINICIFLLPQKENLINKLCNVPKKKFKNKCKKSFRYIFTCNYISILSLKIFKNAFQCYLSLVRFLLNLTCNISQ